MRVFLLVLERGTGIGEVDAISNWSQVVGAVFGKRASRFTVEDLFFQARTIQYEYKQESPSTEIACMTMTELRCTHHPRYNVALESIEPKSPVHNT